MGEIVLFGGIPQAKQVFFDNSTNGFQSTDAQAAIEEAISGLVLKNVPCLGSVYLGAAVRLSAGTAINAQADSLANSNVVGLVEEKPTTTTCHIRVTGTTLAVFSSLDETLEYFLSDTVAGGLTTTPPVSGAGKVVLKIGKPFSSTEMVVIPGDRIELEA